VGLLFLSPTRSCNAKWMLDEGTPDHVTISRTRRLLDELHATSRVVGGKKAVVTQSARRLEMI
jgi:hypothetical protein